MSQTITRNDGNVSVYVFDDSVNVDLSATPNATVRNNGGNDFDIGDLNASNATLHSGVTAPSGWMGGKHTYDGSSWGPYGRASVGPYSEASMRADYTGPLKLP